MAELSFAVGYVVQSDGEPEPCQQIVLDYRANMYSKTNPNQALVRLGLAAHLRDPLAALWSRGPGELWSFMWGAVLNERPLHGPVGVLMTNASLS